MTYFFKAIALVLLFCNTTSYAESAPKSNITRIICLGDSLTAGFGLKKEEAYPALLQKELNKKSKKCEVINAGISGNTSAGGLRRINWYFAKRVDILILALGANDGLRGLNTEKTYENLEKTILKARSKNPKVRIIIAGMKVPPNMGEEYCKKFDALFPLLAKKNKCELIGFLLEGVAGQKQYNQADGIHPNAIGQKKLMNNVLKQLNADK